MIGTMTFADVLRRHRKEQALKQSELAEILGTSQQTIANWEGGMPPASRYLSAIAQVLDIDEGELVSLINAVPENGRSMRERIDEQETSIRLLKDQIAQMQLDMSRLFDGIRTTISALQQSRLTPSRDGHENPPQQRARS